jgi:hypothetical protein
MPCIGVYCEDPTLFKPTQVEWDDCLACAATWENPCTMQYPVLKAIQEDQANGHYFPSVTALTGCLRQAWLRHTMDYFDYPSSQVTLLVGTAFHSMLEHNNGSGALAEVAVRWTTPEGVTVGGTVDLYHPEQHWVRDWKTAKAIQLKKLPYGSHEAQVNLYGFLLAHNERQPRGEVDTLRMVYFDKRGPDTKGGEHNGIVTIEIPKWPEKKTEQFIRQRAAVLGGALQGETIPPMIQKKDRWACHYCPIDIQKRCRELGS